MLYCFRPRSISFTWWASHISIFQRVNILHCMRCLSRSFKWWTCCTVWGLFSICLDYIHNLHLKSVVACIALSIQKFLAKNETTDLISLHQAFLFLKLKTMKPQMGSRGVLYPFFNIGARWGWVISTTPWATLLPGNRPGTHFTEGWVCLMASLNRCGKSCLPLGFNTWTIQAVLSIYLSSSWNWKNSLKGQWFESEETWEKMLEQLIQISSGLCLWCNNLIPRTALWKQN